MGSNPTLSATWHYLALSDDNILGRKRAEMLVFLYLALSDGLLTERGI